MSRKIEFRGKSLKSNHWVYGSYTKEKLEVIPFKYINDGVTHWRIDPATLGQYICTIGEQKIYEGDIFQLYGFKDIAYIKWNENDLKYNLISSKGEYKVINLKQLETSFTLIGNIHDNPELIEVTNE